MLGFEPIQPMERVPFDTGVDPLKTASYMPFSMYLYSINFSFSVGC